MTRTADGDVVAAHVQRVSGLPRLEWAAGTDVSLPLSIASQFAGYEAGRIHIDRAASHAGEDAVDVVRARRAYTSALPMSSRLPFSYQIVPMKVRSAIGHALGRLQRTRSNAWAAFPRWPLDLSADVVADLIGNVSPFAGGPAPVLLSHDLDTGEGLSGAVESFLEIEERSGARSANYIVPCAWPIDYARLDELAQRGHEVGIHGYDHSNKTPFAAPAERRTRLDGAKPLIERYGIRGYRAPSLVRTRELLADLADLYQYDASMPTSGGMFPVPNNGCATARPYRIGKIWEIPLSMPRDGSLLFLGYRPKEILGLWRQCAEKIAASGGVVSLLTHCERRFSGDPEMLRVYAEFLAFLKDDPRFAFSTTADVCARVSAYTIA